MIPPPLPADEIARLQALDDYSILDTLPEKDFDDITRIATQICGTPISLVSLVDKNRQWFKSRTGLNVTESPRELAFCAHAILTPDQPFIINNSLNDERFADNPLVLNDPNVIFYAGIPLVNPEGFPLGTLCVIDHKPKELTPDQLTSLKALADQVMKHFELRRTVRQLKTSQVELMAAYQELDQFAHIIAHDLKGPLNNIISLADLIQTLIDPDDTNSETAEFLGLISTASHRMTSMIDSVLKFAKQNQVKDFNKELVDWRVFVNEVLVMLRKPEQITVDCITNVQTVSIHRTPMQQILLNLCSNAFRFTNKPGGHVIVELRSEDDFYRIAVTDNGPGIAEEYHQSIFGLFHTLKDSDNGEAHFGIGLATVRKIVTRLGGTISVTSHEGVGTSFVIVLPKL